MKHNYLYKNIRHSGFISALIVLSICGYGVKSVLAQGTGSMLYIPLIGITSVPTPLALPKGPGKVTYNYAVKNFLKEVALTEVQVVDNNCSPVKFVEGDDNDDAKLDYEETWRYSCATKLSTTTNSFAMARGTANNITAMHKAYATVVVGSLNPPPLVSIINITKVAYPLSLPSGGGPITFTYKVNNPGVVSLSNVSVVDDKCNAMSGKLGDTNYNNLLDMQEVWIYTCTTNLTQTTANTVTVTAYANGLKAVGEATITIIVDNPIREFVPDFPETGTNSAFKINVWTALSAILAVLILFLIFRPKTDLRERNKRTPRAEIVDKSE